MTHIAVQEALGGKSSIEMEHVADKEYLSGTQESRKKS
jgi:hypothetical protein